MLALVSDGGKSGRDARAMTSAYGTKQTFPFARHMSAFGGKADMMQMWRVTIFRFYSSTNVFSARERR